MRKISDLSLVLVVGLVMFWSASCLPARSRVLDRPTGDMVLIPAGEFEMTVWDEIENQKSSRVVFVDDFYLDPYLVSNASYTRCVEAGVCQEPVNTRHYRDPVYQDHPVVFVTRSRADSYCSWRGARLPTRAEWEKAAGEKLTTSSYYWGDPSPVCQSGSRMGVDGDPRSALDPDTMPVDQMPPNEYGLYHMTEGVWEWVGDDYPGEGYGPSPQTVGFLRIYRTGGYGPLYTRLMCGFRCARSP